jgi:hypothetical protein
MTSFELPRDRDASASIRGYVYQVDTTIDRWLSLRPAEELELERGEDIDLLSPAWEAEGEVRRRLLEQVKHSHRSVTLRSTRVVAAVANFADLRHANPGAPLFFRYTTNAGIGQEQLSRMPGKKPAIQTWIELQQVAQFDGLRSPQRTALRALRRLLRALSCPAELPEATWTRFRAFLSDASEEEFFELVQRFEWSTQAPPSKTMGLRLQIRLLEEGHARDPGHARQQYERLFFFVFQLLSQEGHKSISLPMLREQLALPALNLEDQARLNALTAGLDALSRRVEVLEGAISSQGAQLSQLVERATRTDEIVALHMAVDVPSLEIPPSVSPVSERARAAEYLLESVRGRTWTMLHGGIGWGKTELATACARRHLSQGHPAAWVRLRGLSLEACLSRLDAAGFALLQRSAPAGAARSRPPEASASTWAEQLGSALPPQTLLVLDDVPLLDSGHEFTERLLALARSLGTHGHRLLSTSQHELPAPIAEVARSLGNGFEQRLTPPLDEAEVRAILQSYGALPERLTEEMVRTARDFTRGHPQHLASVASYLRSREWRFGDDEFEALLTSSHADDLRSSTRTRLRQMVPDPQSTELLLRLNLLIGSFAPEDVRLAASVAPAVPHPDLTLHPLVGTWVQRSATRKFEVSPLIRVLGSDDLARETRRACYVAFGGKIMGQSTLSAFDAANAVSYFTSGEDFDRAGRLLCWALRHLAEEDAPDRAGLLGLWWSLPLPARMSLPVRVLLRAQQVGAGARRGKTPSVAMQDLSELVERCGPPEALELLGAFVASYPALPRLDFALACRLAGKMLRFVDALDTAQVGAPGSRLEGLLWWNTFFLRTPEHLEEWLSMVEGVDDEVLRRACDDPLATECCEHIVRDLWIPESEKPAPQQDWEGVSRRLSDLAQRAQRRGFELLWACAAHAEAVVGLEQRGDSGRALQVASDSLAQAQDPRARFLLEEVTGTIHATRGRHELELRHLLNALSYNTQAFPTLRANAGLKAAHLVGFQDAQTALHLALEAAQVARASELVPPRERAKALGELAISQWLAGHREAAVAALDEGVAEMFDNREDTSTWRNLLWTFGHVVGSYLSLNSSGQLPRQPNGAPFTMPQRTMFLNAYLINAAYDAALESVLPGQLSLLSAAMGRHDRAVYWARQAVEMARASGSSAWLAVAVSAPNLIPSLLLEDRYADALDLALQVAALRVPPAPAHASPQLAQATGLEQVLGPPGSERRQMAEYAAIVYGLMPVFLRLAAVALQQGDVEPVRAKVREVAALLREVAELASEQDAWNTAATLVEQAFDGSASSAAFALLARDQSAKSETLATMASLAATLQRDATLEEAVAIHGRAFLEMQGRPNIGALNLLTAPFVMSYWQRALETRRDEFGRADDIAAHLSHAASLPPAQQLRAVLRGAFVGLSVRASREVEAWLSQST